MYLCVHPCICVFICVISTINSSCRRTEDFSVSPEYGDYICVDEPDAAHEATVTMFAKRVLSSHDGKYQNCITWLLNQDTVTQDI